MAVAHVNGTDLFYTEVGHGVPCLVMHGGLGVDHTQFREWLDPLGDVLHLVYYDHRGNGRSGRLRDGDLRMQRPLPLRGGEPHLPGCCARLVNQIVSEPYNDLS